MIIARIHGGPHPLGPRYRSVATQDLPLHEALELLDPLALVLWDRDVPQGFVRDGDQPQIFTTAGHFDSFCECNGNCKIRVRPSPSSTTWDRTAHYIPEPEPHWWVMECYR